MAAAREATRAQHAAALALLPDDLAQQRANEAAAGKAPKPLYSNIGGRGALMF